MTEKIMKDGYAMNMTDPCYGMEPIPIPTVPLDDTIECDCPVCKKIVVADFKTGDQRLYMGVGGTIGIKSTYVCEYCGTVLTRSITYRMYSDDVDKEGGQ